MLTVHAAGGRRMLEAALEGAHQGVTKNPPKIVAVTVLTSLDRTTLSELKIEKTPADLVNAWASLAAESGLDGVVSSAHEAAALRREFGDDFLIVTPGIRPASSASDDQRRVVTPAEAIRAGADVLVVGRPITGAENLVEAARSIAGEMAEAG
jgi:orotidine-5'-phosphate decarboxylase